MLLSTFSWFTPFYIPTHLILLYFRIDSHYLLFTTHSHNSVLLCRTVAKMHFITRVISVSNKKKILAFNYRRVCQNSSHHPAQHCSLPFSPSSLNTTTPISYFALHHSHCIYWILLTAPGRNNCLPSPFIAALFVSSRHLQEYSIGSALLQTLCGTSVACTQHTGCGSFCHSKHPEYTNAVSEPARLLLLTVSVQ